jgi:porphobilinogen synthase
MLHRPRRLRRNSIFREMVAETSVSAKDFIYPYFVIPGKNTKQSIDAMPGIYRWSIDVLLKDIEEGLKLGIDKILLFGVGEQKSEDASSAYHNHSVVAEAVAAIKKAFGTSILVITDVCTCAYTTHGHCGILKDGEVLNDPTLEVLSKMALSHAQAGADMVAPSDMMDGRIAHMRMFLDEAGFSQTSIMSYAVKYASAYYGPFREAADSAPGKGDRKAYQMDFRNSRESLKEALLDDSEGADILMVKPALAYLDSIKTVKENTLLPLACYNVSGEYSMVKIAAKHGLVDERLLVMENMFAFKRAGADIIITYHAKDILKNAWL